MKSNFFKQKLNMAVEQHTPNGFWKALCINILAILVTSLIPIVLGIILFFSSSISGEHHFQSHSEGMDELLGGFGNRSELAYTVRNIAQRIPLLYHDSKSFITACKTSTDMLQYHASRFPTKHPLYEPLKKVQANYNSVSSEIQTFRHNVYEIHGICLCLRRKG